VPTCGQRQTWLDEVTDEEIHVELHAAAPDLVVVDIGPWPRPDPDGVLSREDRRSITVRRRWSDAGVALEMDGARRRVAVELDGERVSTASIAGRAAFRLVSPFPLRDAAAIGGEATAPLPGTVIAVHVAPGEQVVEGQLLLVIEAMKMEHRVTARSDGTVSDVLVTVGDRIDAGDLLVTMADGP